MALELLHQCVNTMPFTRDKLGSTMVNGSAAAAAAAAAVVVTAAAAVVAAVALPLCHSRSYVLIAGNVAGSGKL